MSDEGYVCTSLYDFEDEGQPCEVLYMPTVCIIESPSPDDRLLNRREALAISEALRLANIRNKVFDVSGEASFTESLKEIRDYCAIRHSVLVQGERTKYVVPRLFLHISCHGNEQGIGFTDGHFCDWFDLGKRLLSLAKDIGLYDSAVSPCANLLLCMSSCRGLHAKAMASSPQECPFMCLIGCKENVQWTDAVTAFNTFYHQAITKERTIPNIIQSINDASLSPEVFELVTVKDVGVEGFGDAPVVVLMSADENGRLRWSFDIRTKRPNIPCIWMKDQVCDPESLEPITDPVTGGQLQYFDDPAEAVLYMQKNSERPCQVERCAAQEINIRFVHKI